MHMGATEGPDRRGRSRGSPMARRKARSQPTAASAAPMSTGCSPNDRQRGDWLARLGASGGGFDYEAGVDATLDGLAAHLEKHVDLDRLIAHAR